MPFRALLPLAALFALAHTWGPVPYSNQNQYLLHAAARAGAGDLAADWLANTADPTPLFSAACALATPLGAWPFQLAFALLLAGYFVALIFAARGAVGLPDTPGGKLALAAGVVAAHAAVWRVLSVAAAGVDYPWYLQAGVANQYLLGPGLQPSAFGVSLLAGVALYAAGRPLLAGAALAAACLFHSTYLLPAALLTGGMMLESLRRGAERDALRLGGAALAGVTPVLLFVTYSFAPTDAQRFRDAQAALAWLRIPHHCDAGQWFDAVAAGQLAFAAAGLWAARPTPVGRALSFAAGGAVALTVVQLATGSATLALMFPWRISALLVPLGTALLLAVAVARTERFWDAAPGRALSAALLLTAGAGGVAVMAGGWGYQTSQAEEELIRAVAASRAPGDVYILPTAVPKGPARRGAWSSTFVPVPPSDRPAIFEMQRFRLGSGAAAYVDFKSVPYRDDEVEEWLRRVRACEHLYASPRWGDGVAAVLRKEGVTHAVVPRGKPAVAADWPLVAETAAYAVHRLPGGAP